MLVAALGLSRAEAQEPVALVEDATGPLPGAGIMDYLAAGTVIHLGAKDRVVVDYLRSCIRETIEGGTVTIGADRSRVVGGTVRRETVACDGHQLRLTADQAAKSGVVVFRAPPKRGTTPGAIAVERTLYGTSPLIDVAGGGRLVIERLDQPGERLAFDVPPTQLMRGTFYDLAKAGHALVPGGVYRASANGRSVVFRIDPFAQPGPTPILGRLLRL